MRAGRILIILPLISFLFFACSLKMRPFPLQIIVNTSDVIMTERQEESTETHTEIPSEAKETESQSEAQQKEFSNEPMLITTEPIEITTAPEEITTGPVEITTGPVTTEAAMTTELVITEPPLSYGTFGRLDIPSIGIGVALNYVDLRDGTAKALWTHTTAWHIFSGTIANMLLRITIIRDFPICEMRRSAVMRRSLRLMGMWIPISVPAYVRTAEILSMIYWMNTVSAPIRL